MLKCKFDWKIQDYWRRLTKPRIKKGYNNKFKVLKRIVYGRSGLVNLEKKCKQECPKVCVNLQTDVR